MGETMQKFFQSIRQNYGEEITFKMKEYLNINTKLAKQKNRSIFLLRCKHDEVMPTFLQINVKHIQVKDVHLKHDFENNALIKFQYKTIKILISDTLKTIKLLQKNIQKNDTYLKNNLPKDIYNKFIEIETQKTNRIFLKVKTKNKKKYDILTDNKQQFTLVDKPNKWIENLTNIDIPLDAQEILALGPKFATKVDNNKIPVHDIICNIEYSIQNLDTNTQDKIRSNICNILTNHKNKNKKQSVIQKNINKKILNTKKYIKENPQLKILKSDKTNKTVIMNALEYDNKIKALLKDETTYKELKNNPTNIYQTKNNNLIKRWEQNNIVPKDIARKLKIHNSLPPKIYGLPKLHKKDIPLRPIISCIQSPFCNLSNFLTDSLSNVIGKNKHYIKDSWHLKKLLKDIVIPENHILISLDVISLYTSIPTQLAKDIITKRWDEIKQHTILPLNEFLTAIEYILTSTYFEYENTFYQQTEGCAMGFSISAVIAQLIMEDLETSTIAKLNTDIPFFYRYVDDCILLAPKNKSDDILKEFNSYHPRLQFTIELEKNEKINFLDLTIHKKNNSLQTEWFTKETWSGRYLNFLSNHPLSQKKSVVIGLADRAISLSDPTFRPKSIKKAKQILYKNNYPKTLVHNIFKERIKQFYNSHNKSKKTTNKIHISLPYIHELSEKIRKSLKSLDLIVCHKSYNTLKSNFSQLKTKTPQNKKSHVIYQIPCSNNNCNKVYIGQTSQHLENRIKTHKYTQNCSTALNKHEKSTKHKFDYDKTKILATEKNDKKRCILEMIHIKKNPNSVNDKTEINHLSKIYHNIL